MSEKTVIELRNVSKYYQMGSVLVRALDNVNLKILQKDLIAIMGPSGSGKTTLLNIMGLLDRPTSGKVYFKGFDVTRLSDSEIALLRNRGIGFVFQSFNLVNRLTVYENIELPLIPRRILKSERYKMVVEALRMSSGDISWLYKKPLQLSGGQQQRVAIARAIVGRPDVILADEPTGNLDRVSAREVMRTFLELNKLGHTIVIVTHDPEIGNCAEIIYEIRDGKITSSKKGDKSMCIAYKNL
ncbi:MAG: ABC transporter ATP-binding protein [Sulfolobales archaeon]